MAAPLSPLTRIIRVPPEIRSTNPVFFTTDAPTPRGPAPGAPPPTPPAESDQWRPGAQRALEQLQPDSFPRLQVVWADNKYHNHELNDWIASDPSRAWRVEVVRRPEGVKGFVHLPKRWVIERTNAWMGRARRNSPVEAGVSPGVDNNEGNTVDEPRGFALLVGQALEQTIHMPLRAAAALRSQPMRLVEGDHPVQRPVKEFAIQRRVLRFFDYLGGIDHILSIETTSYKIGRRCPIPAMRKQERSPEN